MAVPQVGDEIYIDDCEEAEGGLSTVTAVERKDQIHLVDVAEVIGVSWFWEGYLEDLQTELRERFGSRRASGE